jgi:glutamate formiminotransferase/formiminotetrahydrofolate cyclodeaminase
MKPLVECVPNFSEGRRLEVVEAIVNAVRAVPGTAVLDYSSDADHNRSVLTFVGTPEAVEAAAFAAIKKAAELIDLTKHSGEHPRIGATDVVPVVPIRGIEMKECVAIAQRLGKRVGEELGIPVYLYEQAATRPDRENLANLRKGEYEGLLEAIKTDPDRAPDYGPFQLGPAGATVIGARAPLIAYNVYLNTSDVEIANKIARAIRHSSGGLRYLKALGLLVNGRAQVSMNLTDYSCTPIHRIQEMIRTEGARYGCMITQAELVGLIPEQALIDAVRWYLQLDLFKDEQILEHRLQQEEESIIPQPFLDAVASGEPTPGGGSVAALAGGLAAGLASMVARATVGKKKYAEVEAAMQAVARTADELRASLTRGIADDSDAFGRVLAAYRLDKSDPERPASIQVAVRHAAEVPLETAQLSMEALEQLKIVAEQGNVSAASDAGAGAHMALAAVEAAALNVLINIRDLEEEALVTSLQSEILALRDRARAFAAEIQRIVENRAGLA